MKTIRMIPRRKSRHFHNRHRPIHVHPNPAILHPVRNRHEGVYDLRCDGRKRGPGALSGITRADGPVVGRSQSPRWPDVRDVPRMDSRLDLARLDRGSVRTARAIDVDAFVFREGSE